MRYMYMKDLFRWRLWKIFIVAVMAMIIPMQLYAASETLHYVITYKWGLIHKEAGTASLSMRESDGTSHLTLTARTKPWADKVFCVRDTLISDADSRTMHPRRYVKSAHEGGRFSRDEIRFTRSGNHVSGEASRLRVNKKGERSQSNLTLKAEGATFDMLSVFYYLRSINYSNLSRGGSETVNIFSGKQTERLTIRCEGKERIKLRDGTHREAWHIRFRFTGNGGRKSSDDIDAWISTDPRHIPLQLIGNLPIGQVRVYYTP